MTNLKTRNEKILSGIDPSSQIGIEIGPLASPVVTREMGQICYVDHVTTEELRVKYSTYGNIEIDRIVDVDYVWGQKSLLELTQDRAPFDYLIASHVIEHVPDLIGWLNEIRAILKSGGFLSLAIPDKRRCFDYNRPLTRTADVIEAHLLHRKQPSARQIFDHYASAVRFQGNIAWSESVKASNLEPCHSDAEALDITTAAFVENRYCDVHCWVFTPQSFFGLLLSLSKLDLINFDIARFYNTEGCEFLIVLRATEKAEPVKISDFLESLSPESLDIDRAATAEKYEQQRQDLERQVEELHQCIQAMESSKFWQIRKKWFWLKQFVGR